jgi:hypothetical protein
MIVYVWARRNPQVLMNFLGVFNFTAPFMPWVLLGFSLLLSGQLPVADLIGIGAGHAYYYLMDVYPILYGGRRPLRTPTFLKTLLDPPEDVHLAVNDQEDRENQPERLGDSPHNQPERLGDSPHDPLQRDDSPQQEDLVYEELGQDDKEANDDSLHED